MEAAEMGSHSVWRAWCPPVPGTADLGHQAGVRIELHSEMAVPGLR
jgi:hypothetical protein